MNSTIPRQRKAQLESDMDSLPLTASKHRGSMSMPRRTTLRTAFIALFLFSASIFIYLKAFHVDGADEDIFNLVSQPADWDERRDEVKKAFVVSWDAYAKYAWGMLVPFHSMTPYISHPCYVQSSLNKHKLIQILGQDRFHPISKTGSQMSPKGLGWMIVDGLDTMMIMGLTSQLADARKWLSRKLTYDQHQDVNTFETTIRMLGGLLSAHYLSTKLPGVSSQRDYIYLNKSIDLADRLLGAYESPSGIPYASVQLDTGAGIVSHTDGGSSSTAEASTIQMEMKYLAHLTKKEIYWRKAEKVMQILDDNKAEDGLLPIFVSANTGKFTSREIRLGSRGDSYYEYLIKQYLQTGELIYLKMWEEALAGIEKHLVTTTKHSSLHIVAELPQGIGGRLSPKMDHLVCFLPGSIALGVTGGLTIAEAKMLSTWNNKKQKQIDLAKELMKSCWAMYAVTETGLAPEIVWYEADVADLGPIPGSRPLAASSDSKEAWKKDHIIKPLDAHNLQRPETVESLFLMYRITEDPIYREMSWKIFQALQKYEIIPDGEGYTSLDNVNIIPPTKRDNMESFWLAETLKYLYLSFSPSDYLPLTEIVFNTEAHVFPRLKEPHFKTGWERKR